MLALKVSLMPMVTFKITGHLKGCTERCRNNLTKTGKKNCNNCSLNLDQYVARFSGCTFSSYALIVKRRSRR